MSTFKMPEERTPAYFLMATKPPPIGASTNPCERWALNLVTSGCAWIAIASPAVALPRALILA